MVKKLLITLLVLCSECNAAITLVHHTKLQASGTSTVVTIPATTSGNLMTIMVEIQNVPIAITFITTAAGTVSLANKTTSVGSAQSVETWYAPNITSGATTVTVNFSIIVTYGFIYIQEWSGLATSLPLDTTAVNSGSSSAPSTGSFSTTTGDLVIGIAILSGGSAAVGAGFTLIDTDTFSVSEWQTAAGATVNVTANPSTANWAIVGATFKVGGATVTPVPRHH